MMLDVYITITETSKMLIWSSAVCWWVCAAQSWTPVIELSTILQEPEWDVSSAFFANAASHIKPKQTSRKSRENKENEAKREVSEWQSGDGCSWLNGFCLHLFECSSYKWKLHY